MNQRPREEARFFTFFTCLLLNLGLTFGSIFCPITAFHLPVEEGVLAAVLALVCLLSALLYRYRRAGLWMLGLWVLALAGVLLLAWEDLEQGTRYVYTRLTSIYHIAYDYLQLPAWRPRGPGDATCLFALWGGALASVNAWVIRRRQSVAPALLLDALPLALCLVVVDTPPDLWCLILFLASACLLILTQSSRVRSPRGGSRLTLGLALPVVAVLVAICLAIPPATYTRTQSADEILQAALNWAGKVLPLELNSRGNLQLNLPATTGNSAGVDLRMGPRQHNRRVVMEVLAEESGALYLRGGAFGAYTGLRWDNLPEDAYAGCPEPEQGLLDQTPFIENVKTLSIRTRLIQPEIYVPYYLKTLPEVGTPRQDARLDNSDRVRTYDVMYWTYWNPDPAGQLIRSYSRLTEYDVFVENADIYTGLPEASRNALLDIAQEAGLTDLDQGELPQAVTEFVRSSARYDLDTPSMPAGQSDFAAWFLTESDTGYCVHFAAATAAMLRALQVPARVVTGYLVDAEAGNWTEVTMDNAHAWAEYYCWCLGWVPLEATPPDGVDSTLRGEESTEPSSQPDEDPEDTEPSAYEPTEKTEPTEDPNASDASKDGRGFVRLQLPIWLACGLALLCLALLRRPVTLRLRRREMGREPPNRQLLHRWRLALPLARLLGQNQPEELEALALKARFSQHTITQEELGVLAAWQTALEEALRKAPLWKRLYARWILVLI